MLILKACLFACFTLFVAGNVIIGVFHDRDIDVIEQSFGPANETNITLINVAWLLTAGVDQRSLDFAKRLNLTAIIGAYEFSVAALYIPYIKAMYFMVDSAPNVMCPYNFDMAVGDAGLADIVSKFINYHDVDYVTLITDNANQARIWFKSLHTGMVRLLLYNPKASSETLRNSLSNFGSIPEDKHMAFIISLEDNSGEIVDRILTEALMAGQMESSKVWLVTSVDLDTTVLQKFAHVAAKIITFSYMSTPVNRSTLRDILLLESVNHLLNATKSMSNYNNPQALDERLLAVKSKYLDFASVEFNSDRYRRNYYLHMLITGENNVNSIGTISQEHINGDENFRLYSDMYQIAIVDDPPFVIGAATGNPTGFSIDLLRHIALKMNMRFRYVIPADGEYGVLRNGVWSGLIGHVVKGKADFALNPINVLNKRKQAVTFTRSLFEGGYNAIMVRGTEPFDITYLMKPLSYFVWLSILCTFVLLTLTLWITDKISPNERKPIYNLPICLFLMLSGLTMAKLDVRPRKLSARIFYLISWFGSMLYVTTYGASLTAFFLLQGDYVPFSNFEEMYSTPGVKWAFTQGTSLVLNFQNASVNFYGSEGELYENIFNKASRDWPSQMYIKNKMESLNNDHNLVYVGDYTTNQYAWAGNCKKYFTTALELREGLALGVAKNRPELVERLNKALDIINVQGIIVSLETKWLRKGRCDLSKSVVTAPSRVTLSHAAAVFILVAVGAIAGFGTVALEHAIYKSRLFFERCIGEKFEFGHRYRADVTSITTEGIWISLKGKPFYMPVKDLQVLRRKAGEDEILTPQEMGLQVNNRIIVMYDGNNPETGTKKFVKMR